MLKTTRILVVTVHRFKAKEHAVLTAFAKNKQYLGSIWLSLASQPISEFFAKNTGSAINAYSWLDHLTSCLYLFTVFIILALSACK